MINLKADQLKKVKGILAGHVPECDVLVYGSRADGSAKAHSYLDLAVMAVTPLTALRLEKLTVAFDKAGFPFRLEAVDWAATGKDYRKEIKKTGVLIQTCPKK